MFFMTGVGSEIAPVLLLFVTVCLTMQQEELFINNDVKTRK